MPNRLTPVTRQRLTYIGWFFIIDWLVCFAAGAYLPPTSSWALWSLIVAIVFALAGGCILAVIYATRDKAPEPLRGSRSRE